MAYSYDDRWDMEPEKPSLLENLRNELLQSMVTTPLCDLPKEIDAVLIKWLPILRQLETVDDTVYPEGDGVV